MDFDADAPIQNFESDALLFGEFARGLAREVLAYDSPTSFVIGINGEWGSGKTSLLHLVRLALLDNGGFPESAKRPIVFWYSPWLVRNRDALLRDLLPELSNQIRLRFPKAHRLENVERALQHLDRYANAVRGVEIGLTLTAATATLFAIPVVPWLAPLISAFTSIGQLLGLSNPPPTLDDLRASAQAALKDASIRIVVLVDDLDRLEPGEIVDMTRLVRSTLDLPHLAFVMAYDRTKVAGSIKNQLGIDGEEYLEKIVQLPVDVPDCSSYELTHLFGGRLEKNLPKLTDTQRQRLSLFVWRDIREMFLSTPRDVVRILNGHGFGWTRVKGEVDPADHLITSALRVKAPAVLAWCLSYCRAFFMDAVRMFSKEKLIEKFAKAFQAACLADGIDPDGMQRCLQDVMPGFGGALPNGQMNIFASQSLSVAQAAAREMRVASPQHWRKYFDLTPGRYGFSEAWFSSFVATACKAPTVAGRELVALASRKVSFGGSMVDGVLDRLKAEARGVTLTNAGRMSLLRMMADAADDIAQAVGEPDFLEMPILSRIDWLARAILQPLTEEERTNAVCSALKDGAAFGWLMYFVRSELFAHGRAGDRGKQGDGLFDVASMDRISEVALQRIRDEVASGSLLSSPELAVALFTWRDIQQSDREVRKWVADIASKDAGLLAFLDKVKQLVRATGGDFWKIDRETLSKFLDADTVLERLKVLSESADLRLKDEATTALKLLSADD